MDGEHQPVPADNGSSALQVMRQEHATRGDVQVLAQVGCDWMRKSGDPVHRGEPLGIEQHQISPVAKDHLQPWHRVECACQNRVKELDAGVIVPAEPVCDEGGINLRRESGVVSSLDRRIGLSHVTVIAEPALEAHSAGD